MRPWFWGIIEEIVNKPLYCYNDSGKRDGFGSTGAGESMNIIAVDDERIALEALMSAIIKAAPEAGIHGFRKPEAIFEYIDNLEGGRVDVAFMDIDMRGNSGLEVARALIKKYPSINIIFTTGYSEYTLEALEMHASGYIMKPVTAKRVKEELAHLRNPIEEEEGNEELFVRTFGNFEVFAGDVPVTFKYQKTRELFAYLIDRRGALCRNNEIISVIFEDDSDESSHVSYLKNIRSDLVSVLERHNKSDCLVRSRGEIGIKTGSLKCDYFEWLDNPEDATIRAKFKGEYMSQYSWAEYTLGNLLKETDYV